MPASIRNKGNATRTWQRLRCWCSHLSLLPANQLFCKPAERLSICIIAKLHSLSVTALHSLEDRRLQSRSNPAPTLSAETLQHMSCFVNPSRGLFSLRPGQAKSDVYCWRGKHGCRVKSRSNSTVHQESAVSSLANNACSKCKLVQMESCQAWSCGKSALLALM